MSSFIQLTLSIGKIYKLLPIFDAINLFSLRPFLIECSVGCLWLLILIDCSTIYLEVSLWWKSLRFLVTHSIGHESKRTVCQGFHPSDCDNPRCNYPFHSNQQTIKGIPTMEIPRRQLWFIEMNATDIGIVMSPHFVS